MMVLFNEMKTKSDNHVVAKNVTFIRYNNKKGQSSEKIGRGI